MAELDKSNRPKRNRAPSRVSIDKTPYTAIIHFHGIGRQRRYEELSHLVDGLDQFTEADNDPNLGKLREHTSLEERPSTSS